MLVGCSSPKSPNITDDTDTEVYSVYLAPLFVHRPLRGTEVWEGTASSPAVTILLDEIQPDFLRMPIYWSHVEKYPGVYIWPSNYDLDVEYLRSKNILPILTVKMAPDWARSNPNLCGRPDDISDYANFVAKVAERYPGDIIIEIWNEPDVPDGYGEADYYGCWGDLSDPNFGGDYYRQVLDASYPLIKQANPKAYVLAGALMLNCFTCDMANYIKGWADSPNYDGISFHHYTWYPTTSSLPEAITYLAQFTNKDLWLTETAVVANVCSTVQEQRSVYWANLVRNDYRLTGVSWFFLQPSQWRCVDLLYPDWSKKPVYKEWMP